MDEPEAMKDADRLWDAEIRERVLAVERGEVVGIPYEQVLASIDERLVVAVELQFYDKLDSRAQDIH